MIDEFICFAKEFLKLVTLALVIIVLALFLFGFIEAIDAIVYLFDLATPLWGRMIKNWGFETFGFFAAALFLIWYFVLGHPDLRNEEE